MTRDTAIAVLTRLAGARYRCDASRLNEAEEVEFLEAVTTVSGEPEAGRAAEVLAARDALATKQLTFRGCFDTPID